MLYFDSDYMEGAHPKILEKLVETNFEQTSGYGSDRYTASAKEKIKKACNNSNAEIFFLVGGTQTNSLVIKSLLRPTEGVISADTGHIVDHEAGAIETLGHKVLTIPHHLGKINAMQVEAYMEEFNLVPIKNHMVQPGMIYISHPTEFGTLYSKKELEDLYLVSKKYNLPLFMDGARLGYALSSNHTDVNLEIISKNTDVFYIGGTKVGAMFGEALVYNQANQVRHLFTLIKQHGALLAKGRLLGIQFDTLFTDDLYCEISKHAIKMAEKLKNGLIEKGYQFYLDSYTNQQFVIVDNQKLCSLQKDISFSLWGPYDDTSTIIRFCTSWATQESDVDQVLNLM